MPWSCLNFLHASGWVAQVMPGRRSAVDALEAYEFGHDRKWYVEDTVHHLQRLYLVALLVVEAQLRDTPVPRGANLYSCLIDGKTYIQGQRVKTGGSLSCLLKQCLCNRAVHASRGLGRNDTHV
eukprot:849550-Amphidinium_carterae.1